MVENGLFSVKILCKKTFAPFRPTGHVLHSGRKSAKQYRPVAETVGKTDDFSSMNAGHLFYFTIICKKLVPKYLRFCSSIEY